MEERVLNAALAGLLHDIGKVEQRARVDPWNPAPGVEQSGQPVHATWSIYFSQNYVPETYRSAALHGAYHHNPEASPAEAKSLSKLVALADKLSAGERADQPKDYEKKQPPQQMVSIFDRIALKGEPRQSEFNYIPLGKLALDDKILFPGKIENKETQSEAYELLRLELQRAAQQNIPAGETYLENLLAAMQRLTWCVPSAYYLSLPDVSLYDHARMTAAMAVCLSGWDDGDVEELLRAVERDFQKYPRTGDDELLSKPAALLVGGDISGVQDFIYTLSSKGAAKTLRGRSFYLQLLTEALLRYTLQELGLPATNVIYSGGGHFYLLAPVDMAERLPEIQNYITKTLLQHHGTSLYLATGFTQVPVSGFRIGEFTKHWKEMHHQLGRAKRQRYTELGDQMYSLVFEPQPHGGNRDNTCSVCGEEREHTSEWEGDAEAKICSLCLSFYEKIGKGLPKAEFVALGFGPAVPTSRGDALDVLHAFGMQVLMGDDAREIFTFDDSAARSIVWSLDDTDVWPEVVGLPTARVTRYTVNLIPQVRDADEAKEINDALTAAERAEDRAEAKTPKTFTHLQAQAAGIKRLGVLRMDMDDLGEVFIRGFDVRGKSRATLARLSTLSLQISLFFEGWVKRICEQHPGLVYAVYAGGDDVFLLGPWDRMSELARTISSDLRRYTGNHADIHISGGMAFIPGKYPIYQAAEEADQALDQAKNMDDNKNAFSFLGQAWKWDSFDQVAEKAERLQHIITELKGPRKLLQNLRQLAMDEADRTKQMGGRPVWGPWMWRGVYQLKRMEERAAKKDPALANELSTIRSSLDEKSFKDINQWGTAARWAQLILRES